MIPPKRADGFGIGILGNQDTIISLHTNGAIDTELALGMEAKKST